MVYADDIFVMYSQDGEIALEKVLENNKDKIFTIKQSDELFRYFEDSLNFLNNLTYYCKNNVYKAHYIYKNKDYEFFIHCKLDKNNNFIKINKDIKVMLFNSNFDYNKHLIEKWNYNFKITKEQREKLDKFLLENNIIYKIIP